MSIRICILVADKLGEMHVIVPYDIWKRANFIVELVSIEKKNTIVLENGVKISCQYSLDKVNLTQYNAIYLPGGQGYTKFTHVKTDPKLKKYLMKDFCIKDKMNDKKPIKKEKMKWILATCSSPTIIKEWDLCGDTKMACSCSFKDEMGDHYVDNPVHVENNIITGNGVGSIMEFALTVIDTLDKPKTSEKLCASIGYKRK